MNRHLSRMIAMQSLYEWQFRSESDLDSIAERNIEEYSDKCEAEFVTNLVHGVRDNFDLLDKQITEAAQEWPLDQIPLIDKTILQVAIYELKYKNDAPAKVVINEAVELSKEFGADNSSKFVNGVLGTVYKNNEKELKETKL